MIALFLAVLALFSSGWSMTIPQFHHRPAPVCYEDMSCWDCSTMGNRKCGPRAQQ